jgi:glycosyltransferase involved in cell wall biosynthesis
MGYVTDRRQLLHRRTHRRKESLEHSRVPVAGPSEPSVAVVITAYNAAAFLRDAVATVRAQTVRIDEIIVVDDGSDDDTVSIATDLGVRVVRIAHGGSAAARNAGIAVASSQWIALLDVDDVWHPEKVEFQLDALESHPDIGIAFTDFDAVRHADGALIGVNVVRAIENFSVLAMQDVGRFGKRMDRDEINEMLPVSCAILTSTAMFRRETALRVGGFSTALKADDVDFFMRLTAIVDAVFVDLPLVGYMQHSTQITAQWNLESARIALYDHVGRHRVDYHERTVRSFWKEYPIILYRLAATDARRGKYWAAAVRLARAFGLAVLRGNLPRLIRMLSRGKRLSLLYAKTLAPALRSRKSEPNVSAVPTSVNGIEIPWRIRANAELNGTPAA